MKLICAVNNDWAIGYRQNLLYDIPQDMQYFKYVTMGKTVIMGTNTFNSLRVKPLPNRTNIVLSNSISTYYNTIVCNSVSSLKTAIKDIPTDDIIVIGGQSIYSLLLPECSTAYITKVYSSTLADAYFPVNLDMSNTWRLVKRSEWYNHNGISYNFNTYIRTNQ